MSKIGLFLGAGASYELGMPLVWNLTTEFKRYFTAAKLKNLNLGWRQQGEGYPEEIVNEFIRVMDLPNTHYESLLGNLENKFLKGDANKEAYHGLYIRFIEAIYFLLLERQIENLKYIESNIKFFEGFKSLIQEDSQLWVFSLNHDLITECFAAHFKVPISCGFTNTVVSFPRRNKKGEVIGELKAETITGHQIESSEMNYFTGKTKGINLLKIHGALDVFTYQDGKNLLKLLPLDNSIRGYIEALRLANEELICTDDVWGKLRSINELTYTDVGNEVQFLRRTLLSGAYKFNERMSQVLPKSLLKHFESNLYNVDKLVCIGYGFGDDHINRILRKWIDSDEKKTIEIVNPGIFEIPSFLLHVPLQINLVKSGMSDYLDKIANIQRSDREKIQKELLDEARKNQFSPDSGREFQDFVNNLIREKVEGAIKRLESLPRDESGDVDVQAVGKSVEELTVDISSDLKISSEDLMSQYLDFRKSKKQHKEE